MNSQTPSNLFSYANLDTIPSDLFIHICRYYLRAKDILQLRKTCKVIAIATREHSIWTHAARQACKENQLYEASFDILNMSTRALEYLSTGTHRFNQLVRSELDKVPKDTTSALCSSKEGDLHGSNTNSTGHKPMLTSVQVHHFTRKLDPEFSSLLRLQLIPGGRFLVTANFGRHRTLEIHDLSPFDKPSLAQASSESSQLQPCLTIKPNNLADFSIHSSSSSNDNEVRLLLTYLVDKPVKPPKCECTAEIVDVDLSCSPSMIKGRTKVTVAMLPHSNVLTSLNKDIVAIFIDSSCLVTVWNCTTRKCAQWHTSVEPSQIFTTDTDIIFICVHSDHDDQPPGIYLFTIPELTLKPEELSSYHPKDRGADTTLPFPARILPLTTYRVPSSEWYNCSGLWSIWFDVIHRIEQTDVFSRVKLVHNDNDTGREYGLHILPPAPVGDNGFAHQWPYENHEKILMVWQGSSDIGGVSCHFGDTFPEDGVSRESIDVVSAEVGSYFGVMSSGFCAVKGRMVYCDDTSPYDRLPSEPCIVVVDYLPV
ncbi:hypothetical protein BJ165DRAFT_1488888, partial [Panaeolus papilionaceus]